MTLTVLPAGVKSKKKPTGGLIKKSLRFRSSASAFLSRNPSAVATSNKIFTISFWAKPSLLVPKSYIWFLDCAGQDFSFYYNATYTAAIQLSGGAKYVTTSKVFRDPSAWYHFVLAVDTTQAIDANRLKFYINGSQVTAFSSAQYPAQNTTFQWNQKGQDQYIGRNSVNAAFLYDGYFADFYSIDGQQLDASSFGATNALTGVWTAKPYTGTYGTNGFHLNFEDNTNLTALGHDSSGNNNHWTPNNISLSGVTYDSMTDVPTLTSATASNFATLNPLQLPSATLSNGNLTASGGSAFSISTIGMSSGKFYAEMTVTTVGGESSCGISQGGYTTQTGTAVGTTLNGGATAYGYLNDGSKFSNGVNPAYGSSYTSGDVIGIAFDATAGTLTFYKNNTSQGSAYTGLTSGPYFFAVEGRAAGGTNNCSINFGQRPFTYTPPTGFVALNTYNLPDGTVTMTGTFTGNANADGTFVWLNGTPTALTINGNAVVWGTHADKLANGFKVRTAAATHNAAGSNTYVVTTAGNVFREQLAQTNP